MSNPSPHQRRFGLHPSIDNRDRSEVRRPALGRPDIWGFGTLNIEAQAAFDRAWRHFQLHAEQRIAVFNFFVASSGLLLTGLAYVLAGPTTLWKLGIAAGALIALISLVFWKLDERSAQIIKVSEAEIERLERESSHCSGVFSAVSGLPIATSIWHVRSVWTFGRSFRLMFLAVAILGLTGMGVSIWRALPSAPAAKTPHATHSAGTSSKVIVPVLTTSPTARSKRDYHQPSYTLGIPTVTSPPRSDPR